MRMKVKDHQGNKIYFSACIWPRHRSDNKSKPYKVVYCSSETPQSDYDEAEQYILYHPWCSAFDVSMECNFGRVEAFGIVRHLDKEGKIEVRGHGRNRRFHVRVS
jgi:hypothetical protein